MILLGISFVFAAINCGLIDYGSIVEMGSDNSTTRIPLPTNTTQSNTVLVLSTSSHLNKPMTIDFGGNNRLNRNDFHFNIQKMWTMI